MENKLKLPVGIESFEEIRRNQYYYVDKTKLIEQLFDNLGKVSLFTRPRRFGKTLNMSMLKCFFEIGTDPTLFDGLYVSENHALCEQQMGQYPVIFLSLKNVEGLNFESAKYQMMELISKEAKRHAVLGKSEILDEDARKTYEALTMFSNGRYQMTEETLLGSLQTLSELLFSHYHKKTVILIDEYDVPLDKAFHHGYYKEMVFLIRAMFGKALKTNDALAFAVLTGCLRVSKESIFTGLNNFKILSITDTRFDEQFGFTDAEVQKLLSDYHLENRFREVKEWYDGYRFGKADVYCPWDVINFVDRAKDDPEAKPEAYWINTSGNDLVKRFIDKANKTTKNEIERLNTFWKAVEAGDTEGIEQYLNRVLSNSISVFDTKARKEEKESSYHNLLVGILTGNADWLVKSNVEAGEGFADIIVETDDPDAGIVIELKYTKSFDEMETACQKALDQIQDRRYQEFLINDDRKDIRLYGITFCKKRCRAITEVLLNQ